MGKWCLIIKVAGNQDRHKSSDEFDFGPLVSMAHLYVFWNEIWPWHIGLRWAIVALWATCLFPWHYDCTDTIWPVNFVGSVPTKWAPSSEFVSSSIPSWQTLTAHAQPFRRARNLAFFLKVPLDSLLVWASSEGSGKAARMRRLAWTFAARTGDKYQIRLTRSKCCNLCTEPSVKPGWIC